MTSCRVKERAVDATKCFQRVRKEGNPRTKKVQTLWRPSSRCTEGFSCHFLLRKSSLAVWEMDLRCLAARNQQEKLNMIIKWVIPRETVVEKFSVFSLVCGTLEGNLSLTSLYLTLKYEHNADNNFTSSSALVNNLTIRLSHKERVTFGHTWMYLNPQLPWRFITAHFYTATLIAIRLNVTLLDKHRKGLCLKL